MGKALVETMPSRFWAKVGRGEDDSCWEWRGATVVGYGVLNISGKPHYAHRLSWEIHVGAIPNGLYVCHSCDNRRCVNPRHLFLGSLADNMADMAKKGRAFWKNKRGEAHNCSRLKEEDVVAIRKSYRKGGITQKELGVQYGISHGHVSNIVLGRAWSHIKEEL